MRRRISPEPFHAFVPHPLPPIPSVVLDAPLLESLVRANVALGRLDAVTLLLPDTSLFLYFYVRKEAVLSSQIEGTQSSLSDLLLYESDEVPGVPLDEVQEVSSYVAAVNYGLQRIEGGFPMSLRLLREMHEVLLSRGRGSEKQPGEFRRSQNWVGGSRPGNALFVPPPPDEVMSCMGALEKFLHDDPERTSPLLKAALAHVQFETIHPFLDGNGRLGRLLIPLLLCTEGVLPKPLLYLSLYLKMHRSRYYELLQQVRLDGDWEAWIAFFLDGVRETADLAAGTARRILHLFEEDRQRIQTLGRAAASAFQVLNLMRARPLLTIAAAAGALSLSVPTITNALTNLQNAGIVQEFTGRQRGRVFAYQAYLALLNEGTELPRNPA